MASEYLDNLVASGLLKAEAPTSDEASGLIRSGAARLADAKSEDLSLESRFDRAYNAAHALSLAGLRLAGDRANNRCPVFQCLGHTLGIPDEKRRVLDQALRKRNLAEYEGATGNECYRPIIRLNLYSFERDSLDHGAMHRERRRRQDRAMRWSCKRATAGGGDLALTAATRSTAPARL